MSVEKFIVRKQTSSFTVIPNNVLQNLRNAEALGLWCYLSSLPPEWEFYKEQLRGHFNIGRDKLDRLINVLQNHSLISLHPVRNAQGQFAQIDLHVHSGENFTINKINELNENAQPRTDLPLTDNQSPVNSSYKRNIKKETSNKKEISKSLCASDDARQSFDRFWDLYPRKKDKQRALKIWVTDNLREKAKEITEKLTQQILNDVSWKNPTYIPYPERYLRWERWNDEVELERIETKKETGTERALRMCKLN